MNTGLKKVAKKEIARCMKEKAVRKIIELGRNHNNVIRLVTKMKIESTHVVGGSCKRGNDGTLYHNKEDRAKLWKAQMSKIMNKKI